MSRTAKRPICGNALNASMTRGFVGRILTRAASPVLRKSGFSAFGAPVFGSSTAMISSKVPATWAVCAWKTGVYPAVMTLGWFRTTICAVKVFATVGGLSVGPATSLRRHRQVVEGRHEGGALVPRQLGRGLRDVLALVRADWDEGDPVHLEARDLQQAGQFGLEFGEALLRILRLRRVHLVDRHDELLDPEDLREVDVLLRLRLHAFRRPDDEDRGVRLGRAGDHVLDEVPVARGVDDREVVLVRVKALVRDVDRQAALPLLLDLVHDERELERGLAHLLGELLEVLEFVRVDIPGVIEDPADGRRLPVVDVADEHEVEVGLRGHGFYPVGRTLSSCRIYAYPTRAIFSIGTNQTEGFTRPQIGGPPTQSHLHGTARSPPCSCGAGRRTPTPSTRRDAGRPLPPAVRGTRIRYPSGAPYRGTVSACTPPRPR